MRHISYIFANTRTGEIEISGTCREDDFDQLQEGPDQVKVIGSGTPATHYYTPLGLQEYTPEQRQTKAQRRPHCNWDNGGMRWVDIRPFPELRQQRWCEIKMDRQVAIDAPLSMPYGTFDADQRSRAAITEALALRSLMPGEPLRWTTADDQAVELSLAELAEVGALIAQRTQHCHETAQVLRQRIDLAATPEELAEITWPQAP